MLPWLRLPNDVVYRPLAARLPHAWLFMVWHRSNDSPQIRKFIGHVEQAKAELE